MKTLLLFCSLIVVLANGRALASIDTGARPKESIVSPLEVNKLLRQHKAVLVDVREWEEVKKGMAEPARWMPLSKIKSNDRMWTDFLATLPKDQLVVIYCHSGRRACLAASELEVRGYRTTIMGKYSDWTRAGLPVRRAGE